MTPSMRQQSGRNVALRSSLHATEGTPKETPSTEGGKKLPLQRRGMGVASHHRHPNTMMIMKMFMTTTIRKTVETMM